MVIVLTITLVSSINVLMYVILLRYKEIKKNDEIFIDVEQQERYKKILVETDSFEISAKTGWALASTGSIVIPTSKNKRKSNYSDKEESRRFREALTTERLVELNKMVEEIKDGRY